MNVKTAKADTGDTTAITPNATGKVCALILCAGSGVRTELLYNKLLHYIGKKPVLETTLDAFASSCCDRILLAVRKDDEDAVRAIIKNYPNADICTGGATRGASVRNGLSALTDCGIVVIHDGARPFITPRLIDLSVEAAIQHGSGILAVPVVDTIKVADENGAIVHTLPRSKLYHMQTPQSFRYAEIADAYARVTGDCLDDSEVFQQAGYTPIIIPGDYHNKKITTAADFLTPISANSVIGTGFDVHQLVANRPFILGGVNIPFEKGLLGHSDADVLTHAIMDALLSAAGLPDIGVLFPDTDESYKDINSLTLLNDVRRRIGDRGFTVGNISAVVMAERPKLSGIIPKIRISLADALGIRTEQVNVSATTTETLGIIGSGKGVAASAVCLLYA